MVTTHRLEGGFDQLRRKHRQMLIKPSIRPEAKRITLPRQLTSLIAVATRF